MLDRDALVALLLAHQEELSSSADRASFASKSELDSHRQTLSEQADELDSRSERIEHMKLMIEKLRHMIFGKQEREDRSQARTTGVSSWKRKRRRRPRCEAVLERVSPAEEAQDET